MQIKLVGICIFPSPIATHKQHRATLHFHKKKHFVRNITKATKANYFINKKLKKFFIGKTFSYLCVDLYLRENLSNAIIKI